MLVRVAAAGVCHSDVHLADGSLGQGRWPMVLGHEGAGTVEAVGEGVVHVAPGDRVVFCMIPSCGACSACRAGRPTLCGPAGDAGFHGTLMDGTSRLALPDGTALQHGLTVACFAERTVVAARGRRAARPRRAAVAGGAARLRRRHRHRRGAQRRAAAHRRARRRVGCGGVGQQVIAGLVLSGAGTIVAVDRDPAMLELSLARGATHAVDARSGDPAAEVRALTGGGADHAFEVVGRPETMRLAWDCLRAGGNAVVVGLARGRRRASPSRRSSSSPTRASRAATTAAATPRLELASLVQLAADGRLQLADVVTHLTDLDGIPEGLERLRSGGGGRTVAIIDAAAAGAAVEP